MDYSSKENFINRELSLLEFHSRVLEEAQDASHPLLERLKFLSIVSSNLDEFFMVRVASLYDLVNANSQKIDASGLTPQKQITKITERAQKLVNDQYATFNHSLKQCLKKQNIILLGSKDLNEQQFSYLQQYYIHNIYPVLTPIVVDKSRPFPLILNKTLNLALLLQNKSNSRDIHLGTIQVPSVLSRLIKLPSEEENSCYIFLEDVIKMNLAALFSGHNILASSCYRITRNADLTLDEEGAEDLLETIEQSLKQRRWGAVVRLEIEKRINTKLLALLENVLEASKEKQYKIAGPLDLTFLMKISGQVNLPHLTYAPIEPQPCNGLSPDDDIFSSISHKDVIMHHPFHSFSPIVEMVQKAAEDPNVLGIKQTLYRVSGNSPLVNALIHAAENGKQVTVLVELKARFDEENNIIWAKRLEKAGCHVIYGLVGLKTHCKILLIVRKESDGIKRYVHLGTGNYNDVTAKIYTDLGIFTANEEFGADASSLFNMLSGHAQADSLTHFSIAPTGLRTKFMELINREAENAKQGKPAKIIAKMNSLVDTEIIKALYHASHCGVEINLIIRGICCLRPGISGISDNITVRSIVGRFLEHSRIYYFYNDGEENIYLSSADWMSRNLNRRVELMFPVKAEDCKSAVKEILDITLRDNVKARVLNSDGSYSKVTKHRKEIVNSQELFYTLAKTRAEQASCHEKHFNLLRPILTHKFAE